jgi:hypothetical protein
VGASSGDLAIAQQSVGTALTDHEAELAAELECGGSSEQSEQV